MRKRGFEESEIFKRFPLLPYEKELLRNEKPKKTPFETFCATFYRQQAKALSKPVELIEKNYQFQQLAKQAYSLSQELEDI